ncbi:MAG: hypothetical protein ACOZE5_13620 [Verrucomicrobiota bacterium]
MKQKITLQNLLFAAALSLGFVLNSALADDSQPGKSTIPAGQPADQLAPAAGNLGLLGQTLGTLTYSRINLDDTTVNLDSYALEINQPLAFGFDGVFGYDYSRSGAFAGSRQTQHTLTAALRAFSNNFNWGKPYVEAGLGQVWEKFAGASDKSLLWEAAAGVEFQVLPRLAVTPYGRYEDTPDLAGSEGRWSVGVKGSFWLDRSWAVTAGFEHDDEQNNAFTVGTNFRF